MNQWIGLVAIFGLLTALKPLSLKVVEKSLTINGREATVYAIVQPDGTAGLTATQGDTFDVRVENTLNIPTSIHWHGLILPNKEDGAAPVTQFPIYPQDSYLYHYPLVQSGTYWMHSHWGFQVQKLLSAPLILLDPEEKSLADQEVTLLLQDFSFTEPAEIYKQLVTAPMAMSKKKADLVDVNYDAFLANYRTLEDPEVVIVEPNTRVRLRVINAAASTNFRLSLEGAEATIVAVDGHPVEPIVQSQFELGVAQRVDLIIKVSSQEKALALLAQGEGTAMQTGLILKTAHAPTPSLTSKVATSAPAFTYSQESNLKAIKGLSPKSIDQKVELVLDGQMDGYLWTINGQMWPEITPIVVEEDSRVEITFKNISRMSHPMHLHGHVFQVTAIDGQPVQGALRDTILVLPHSTVTVQFDANNPGVWPLHCHFLYHAESGMFTVLKYKHFQQSL